MRAGALRLGAFLAWATCAACSGWAAPSRTEAPEGQPARPPPSGASATTLRPNPHCKDLPPVIEAPAPVPGDGTLTVRFASEMSSSFVLSCVRVAVDGVARFMRLKPDGELELPGDALVVVPVAAGEHLLEVTVELRGRCIGIYGYCRGYVFTVRSSQRLSTLAQQPAVVGIVAYEKGGVTTPLEERPAVRFTSG